MSNSRQEAHSALHPLWMAAHTVLVEAKDKAEEVTLPSGVQMRSFETPNGATIIRLGDVLFLNAEFVTPDGTEEEVRIQFPEDIRDLSEAIVEIDSSTSGPATPPLNQFPKLASDLLALL